MPRFLIEQGYLDRQKALASSEANKFVRELNVQRINGQENGPNEENSSTNQEEQKDNNRLQGPTL